MILIALTACSIPAIREPVAAFFKGTYENCVRFLPETPELTESRSVIL